MNTANKSRYPGLPPDTDASLQALAAGVDQVLHSVLGFRVGIRRIFHLSLFLTASRVVLPKILVLMVMQDGPRSSCPW